MAGKSVQTTSVENSVLADGIISSGMNMHITFETPDFVSHSCSALSLKLFNVNWPIQLKLVCIFVLVKGYKKKMHINPANSKVNLCFLL